MEGGGDGGEEKMRFESIRWSVGFLAHFSYIHLLVSVQRKTKHHDSHVFGRSSNPTKWHPAQILTIPLVLIGAAPNSSVD